jgi:hypothetical protein
MQENTKKIIAGGLIAFGLYALIYGTYLPYHKSSAYVAALGNSGQATTVDQFLGPFMSAMSSPSPIGQEEIVRNFVSSVTGISGGGASKDENVVRALVAIADRFALPVIERKSALSQAQTYIALSQMYLTAYKVTNDEVYRRRGRDTLLAGLEISPDRPQFLYAMFDYEREYGSPQDTIKYGKRIVELWPSDTNTAQLVQQIEASVSKQK